MILSMAVISLKDIYNVASNNSKFALKVTTLAFRIEKSYMIPSLVNIISQTLNFFANLALNTVETVSQCNVTLSLCEIRGLRFWSLLV